MAPAKRLFLFFIFVFFLCFTGAGRERRIPFEVTGTKERGKAGRASIYPAAGAMTRTHNPSPAGRRSNRSRPEAIEAKPVGAFVDRAHGEKRGIPAKNNRAGRREANG